MGKPAAGPSGLPEAVAEFLNGKSLKDFHEARSARVPSRKLCANNHLVFAWWESCWICAEEAADDAAKHREAGRVGHEPDNEGDDP